MRHVARFRRVDLYPFTGHPDQLWEAVDYPPGDPVRDAVLRAGRPVTALYSEMLPDDFTGPRSTLLVAITHGTSSDGVTVAVWQHEPVEGPERAYATLCPEVARLDARGRSALVLDVLHAAAQELAQARGWDPARLHACREHVIDQDFTYRWAGAWRSSPDRRHEARAAYTLAAPDGFGRVRLEVRRRGEQEACAISPPAIAFCDATRFANGASTLAWDGSGRVGMTPYVIGRGGTGQVVGRLVAGTWSFVVREGASVRTPGGGGIQEDPAAPVPPVVARLD